MIQRARDGDVEAFAAVFEAFRLMVFRIACRLVGEGDAEDVVMETYLKAWQAMPQFGGRASLKTWLYRIAYNCSVDFLMDVPDTRQARADETLGSKETAESVRQALMRLAPDHKNALLMRYADDMSYADIAAATGVSIGTVMSRLFYGKRRLKDALREWRKQQQE